jgi:hypothetical protein
MFQFNRFPVKDDDGNVDEAAYNSLKDILICPAADALEMSSFTQGTFNYYFSVVNKEQPSYIMMNSVTTIRSLTSNKLFKQMSYNITAKLFDGTFIDSDYFDKYILSKQSSSCGCSTRLHREVSGEGEASGRVRGARGKTRAAYSRGQ